MSETANTDVVSNTAADSTNADVVANAVIDMDTIAAAMGIDPNPVVLPIDPGFLKYMPNPNNEQLIPLKYNERALLTLSERQNGIAVIATQHNDAGERTGWLSQYPIDLTTYDATLLEIQKSDLTLYAKDKLATLVDGGVSINVGDGKDEKIVWAKTDADSRTNYSGLVMLAQMSNTVTTTWVQTGGALTLNAGEIIKVGMAVGGFVQACYGAYSGIQADIDTGIYTTNDQIDKAPWPSTSL